MQVSAFTSRYLPTDLDQAMRDVQWGTANYAMDDKLVEIMVSHRSSAADLCYICFETTAERRLAEPSIRHFIAMMLSMDHIPEGYTNSTNQHGSSFSRSAVDKDFELHATFRLSCHPPVTS